nr:S46 family peptidase [Thermoanaerobaculia bacterium]
MNRFLLLATLTLMSTSPSPAEPGKWTPQQILEIDLARLASWGLQVPPTELWRPEGGGLLEAAVQISGCSAGFISPDGLLVTNHHCVFSILQEHATPARDLIHDGFLAKSREEELPGTGVRVTVPHKLTDVTAEIEKAAAGAADDFA